MATLTYAGQTYVALPDETVLDTLLRHGVAVPNACRSGVCHSCLLVASAGRVPDGAQASLREIERRRGLFLACLCRPSEDLELREPDASDNVAVTVVEHARLSDSVLRLRLRCEAPFAYEPGQYVTLRRADGLTRSFSLASLTREPWLELHLRRVPEGLFSNWAHDELALGDRLTLRGPYGSCCYTSEHADAPLMLIALGTGLAPLWGVMRQALAADHRGPITLIHAAAELGGLYMREELAELAAAHPRLRIVTSVLRGEGEGVQQTPADQLAVTLLRDSGRIAEHVAFVCGEPSAVHRVRRAMFLAGLSARRILADAFVPAHTSTSPC